MVRRTDAGGAVLLWVNGRAVGSGPLRPLRGGMAMAAATLVGLGAAVAMPADVGLISRSLLRLALRLAVFTAVSLAAVLFAPAAEKRASAPLASARRVSSPKPTDEFRSSPKETARARKGHLNAAAVSAAP